MNGFAQTRQLQIEASRTEDAVFSLDFDTSDVAGVLLMLDGNKGIYSSSSATRDGYTRHTILIPHELIEPHSKGKTIPAQLWEYDHDRVERVMWTGFIEVKD